MTNGHIFYLVCQSENERNALIAHGRNLGVHLVFHYQALHSSPYYKDRHDGRGLPNADRFTNCLVRLPIYYEMTEAEQGRVITAVLEFYQIQL
jgi:dTDP-4-amino-4,6-dideoxygalactose transaminase